MERHVRYSHRVVRTSWDSDEARWTVEAEHDGRTVTFTAGLVWSCRGYYDYERGHRPEFAGEAEFTGKIVHPQHWPADLDWAGKEVVVIGSGATAVTVVPEMARRAGHVTMLQRSPSYVLSLPQRDPFAARARRWLPAGLAHRVVRWKSILVQTVFYRLSRRRPETVRRLVRKQNVSAAPRGVRRRRRTSRRATTRGTSGCASCPTPTSSRPYAAATRRSSPRRSSGSTPTGSC